MISVSSNLSELYDNMLFKIEILFSSNNSNDKNHGFSFFLDVHEWSLYKAQ